MDWSRIFRTGATIALLAVSVVPASGSAAPSSRAEGCGGRHAAFEGAPFTGKLTVDVDGAPYDVDMQVSFSSPNGAEAAMVHAGKSSLVNDSDQLIASDGSAVSLSWFVPDPEVPLDVEALVNAEKFSCAGGKVTEMTAQYESVVDDTVDFTLTRAAG